MEVIWANLGIMLESLEPIWESLGDQLASSGGHLGRLGGHQVVVASGRWCFVNVCLCLFMFCFLSLRNQKSPLL